MADSIRVARVDDIPAMAGLLGELFAIEADFQPDPVRQEAGLKLLLQSPSAKIWVAEREGRAVGMITLQLLVSTAEGGPVGLIEDVVVAQAWRGHGLGRELLVVSERWARENGLKRLQLLADSGNGQALEFYRRMGWHTLSLRALRKIDLREG